LLPAKIELEILAFSAPSPPTKAEIGALAIPKSFGSNKSLVIT
jgi:hypothetical protein